MDAEIEVIAKMTHWIVLFETDVHWLEPLWNRIGFNTTTHFINDDNERAYSTTTNKHSLPEPPKPRSPRIEYYAHTICSETEGYTNTCPRVEYHIQYRILKRFFNLLYLAHISTARLAEQDIVMKRLSEMMNEGCDNVHKTG